jgi:hypothetical protein
MTDLLLAAAVLEKPVDTSEPARAKGTRVLPIREMQNSMSQRSVADPAAFERANCLKLLGSDSTRPGLP